MQRAVAGAKPSLADPAGGRTLAYAGCVGGNVDEAGRLLFDCAVRASFGSASRVHAVGEGAPWIAAQVEERLGSHARYLIDFLRVLGESHSCGDESPERREGAKLQDVALQQELKAGCLDAILESLAEGDPD